MTTASTSRWATWGTTRRWVRCGLESGEGPSDVWTGVRGGRLLLEDMVALVCLTKRSSIDLLKGLQGEPRHAYGSMPG